MSMLYLLALDLESDVAEEICMAEYFRTYSLKDTSWNAFMLDNLLTTYGVVWIIEGVNRTTIRKRLRSMVPKEVKDMWKKEGECA